MAQQAVPLTRRSKLRLLRERIMTYVTELGDTASSAPFSEASEVSKKHTHTGMFFTVDGFIAA